MERLRVVNSLLLTHSAGVSCILLIPLAVISTHRMIKRLGRNWQRLHRLSYPIAILGVLHYLWLVEADLQEPLLYGGVLAV
jgi:sulfoxide reductase heme-binding subunit YedZ